MGRVASGQARGSEGASRARHSDAGSAGMRFRRVVASLRTFVGASSPLFLVPEPRSSKLVGDPTHEVGRRPLLEGPCGVPREEGEAWRKSEDPSRRPSSKDCSKGEGGSQEASKRRREAKKQDMSTTKSHLLDLPPTQ